jgi:hypothetical protein
MIASFCDVSRKRPGDEKHRNYAHEQDDENNPSKDIEHSCITMTIAVDSLMDQAVWRGAPTDWAAGSERPAASSVASP